MSDQEQYYTIEQTSRLLGISAQKLRRWDEQGILQAQRTAGGHRRYLREVVDRLVAANGGQLSEKNSRELEDIKRTLAEKRRIIQLLVESEGRYRDLVETSHDLIWQTDADGRFTYLNAAANHIFGLAPKDLIGRCFFNFETNGAHVPNRRFLSTLRRNGEVQNFVTHLSTNAGEDRWIGINARITRDERGDMLGIRGTARDVTEQHLAIRRAEHMAMHDVLTDLPNRHALRSRVEAAIAKNLVGTLVMVDLDHFKRINGTFGHGAGDQVIAGLSGVLRAVARDRNCELYRIGEDQFLLHIPEALREDSQVTAAIALDAVRDYRIQLSHNRIIANITASVGIALYPFHGADWDSLLANLDNATCQAKDDGRNRVALFNPASDALRANTRRLHWSGLIEEAIARDDLTLYFQPAVQIRSRQAVHREVFLRIPDDKGRLADAVQFMLTAEAAGLAPALDQRVVARVLTQLHEDSGGSLPYSVNLSANSIANSDWVLEIEDMVRGSEINPERLIFEITEKAAMENVDATAHFIERLRPAGARFALDDFGAGFSSFYYLKRFAVDILKIDGGFTRDLDANAESRAFLRAVNGLAQDIGHIVIAKAVENGEVLKPLKETGTQYAQGHWFAPARPLLQTAQDDGTSISA